MQMECGGLCDGTPRSFGFISGSSTRWAGSVLEARLVDILLGAVTRNKRDNEAGQKNVEPCFTQLAS